MKAFWSLPIVKKLQKFYSSWMKYQSYHTYDLASSYLFKVTNKGTSVCVIDFEEVFSHNPADIYLRNVNNGTIRTNQNDVSDVPLFLLLTLKRFHTYCFHCWLWASKYWLERNTTNYRYNDFVLSECVSSERNSCKKR